MVKEKLHKHFMYKLLKEDLYGEYSFRKSLMNRFTCHLLVFVWQFINNLRARYYDNIRAFRKVPVYFRRPLFSSIAAINAKRLVQLSKVSNQKWQTNMVLKLSCNSSSILQNHILKRGNTRILRYKSKAKILLRGFIWLPLKTSVVKPASFSAQWHSELSSIYRSTCAYFRAMYPGNDFFSYRSKPKKNQRFEVRTFFENLVKPRELRVISSKLTKKQLLRVRNVHLLRYLNLIVTTKDYLKIVKNFSSSFLNKQHYAGNFMSFAEGRLVSVLLRSGFFENGYILNNLIKRGPFLVNGLPLKFSTTMLKAWDCISVSKPLWWYVYSKFTTFNMSSIVSRIVPPRGKRRYKYRELEELRRKWKRLHSIKSPLHRFYKVLTTMYSKNLKAVIYSVVGRAKPRRRRILGKRARRIYQHYYEKKRRLNKSSILRLTVVQQRYRFRKFLRRIKKTKRIAFGTKYNKTSTIPKYNLLLLKKLRIKFFGVIRAKGRRPSWLTRWRRPWKKKVWFPVYKHYKMYMLLSAMRKYRKQHKSVSTSNKRIKRLIVPSTSYRRKKIFMLRKKAMKKVRLTFRNGFRSLLDRSLLSKKVRKKTFFDKVSLKQFIFERPKQVRPMWVLYKRHLVNATKRSNIYHVITPAAPYIELSYKIFSLILFRLPYKAIDTNIYTSIRIVHRFSKELDYTFKRPVNPRARLP